MYLILSRASTFLKVRVAKGQTKHSYCTYVQCIDLVLYKNALRVVCFNVLLYSKGVTMIRLTKLYASLWTNVR